MLGIICALRSEAPRLGPGAAVVISGPGYANAARAAQELLARQRLSALISAGFAGALSPRLSVGQLVLDTSVPRWKALAERRQVLLGPVTTVDRVVLSVAERRELALRTGALAVDMESAAVAEVAGRHHLPFAVVRAITDTAERELVLDWNQCRRPDGTFRLLNLLGQALRTRQGVAEIRQLWYASRIASRRLGHFLRELLQLDAILAGERDSA